MFNKEHRAKRELVMKVVAIVIFLSMVGLALAGAF
jgi:uncharacterized protein YraI